MKQICWRTAGVALAGTLGLLVSAAFSEQLPLPRTVDCNPAPGLGAAVAEAGDLRCLSQSKRVALLMHPVAQAVLAPLDRDYRLHSALHQLKAREAEALAVADPAASHALKAYLDRRAIESSRSEALRDAERELARSQSRLLQLSTDLNAAYGLLWWLNRTGPILSPVQATDPGADAPDMPDSQLVPGAPEDMFFALGLGNQIVAVDPGSETVVVRLGGPAPPEGATPFDTATAARVVTDALVDPDAGSGTAPDA